MITYRECIKSLWYRLTTKLDAEGVIASIGDGIVNVNCSISIIFNVNIYDLAKYIRETYLLKTLVKICRWCKWNVQRYLKNFIATPIFIFKC